jgi:ADP-heptose:LPS heptosyltransferase
VLLVLRALGLGDLLTAVPALRALRRGCPGHDLVLAAPAALDPLVRLAGVAERRCDASGLAPLVWQGGAPDVAVNLHGRGPQSHRLLGALSPRRLVAFGCPAAGHAGPEWRDDEHERDRWCRLVREGLLVPADPADLALRRPASQPAAPGAVVVHPGAAYPARRWPADRFAEVARVLVDGGHEVVVTGGADEVALAGEVAAGAGLTARAVLAGRTDLPALSAQVASARLVVCGDTGVAHLATAFGTPSVLLFGPTPPARWGPPAEGPHTVLWHGTGTGDPWADRVDPSLLDITVEEVVAAALARLRDRAPTGPA